MTSFYAFKTCFAKLGLNTQGATTCKNDLEAFVADPLRAELIRSKPTLESLELRGLAEAFVLEYGPRYWAAGVRQDEFVEKHGLLLPVDRPRIIQWVKELINYQVITNDKGSGSCSASKPRIRTPRKRVSRKRCRVSPEAYEDDSDSALFDDNGLYIGAKPADDDDDDGSNAKSDARTKPLLSAASDIMNFDGAPPSRRIKSEGAAGRVASTHRIKMEPTDDHERGMDDSIASSTSTSLASLGLTEHAVAHTRIFIKLPTSACNRSVGLDSCLSWTSFRGTVVEVCRLWGDEEITMSATCPWFDAPVRFGTEPEQGLQDLVGFVASWWMGVGDREEWCPVTVEVNVEVKAEG